MPPDTSLRRPTVAIPAPYLHWLGMGHNALVAALAERGLGAYLVHPPEPSLPAAARQPAPSHYPRQLLAEAARYMLAIKNECCAPDDVPGLDEQTEAVHALLAVKYAHYRARLESAPPDLVLLVQGIEPNNAALRAAAIDLGLPLLALENTASQRRMVWENIAGMPSIQNLARNFYYRFRGAFRDSMCRQFADRYFADLSSGKAAEHRTPQLTLPMFDHRPRVLFLGQVLTDSSLVFRTDGWRTPLEMMQETARWCTEQGQQLVIKLHPKEHLGADPIYNRPYNRLTWRKMSECAPLLAALRACGAIVDHDNAYDTHSLMGNAAIIVTMSSQAGLEAAMLGKPVITGGNPYYANIGFTLNGNNPDALRFSLQNALSWQPNASASEFGYIFFEHYCVERSVSGLADLILHHQCGSVP